MAPPSLSICLPLLTGSSSRAGHLFSSCISSATNCNERVLWLILSLRLLFKASGVSGAPLGTRGRGTLCLQPASGPALSSSAAHLPRGLSGLKFFSGQLPWSSSPLLRPCLHLYILTHPPSWFSVGTQERGWMGVGLARSGLVFDFTHSGWHFLHLTPRPPGQSAQASSSTNTRSRCWFVEDTGWLPPA